MAEDRKSGDVLRELADRCEREEPSHALDDAIAVATGYPEINLRVYRVPFTTSLDAAMTLVPTKAWEVETNGEYALAIVGIEHDDVCGTSKTPALALCAASLRARLALADGEA